VETKSIDLILLSASIVGISYPSIPPLQMSGDSGDEIEFPEENAARKGYLTKLSRGNQTSLLCTFPY
jgi:hypothetical protein